MEKPWRSQSRAWKLSPAALALAVGLASWGAAALAGEPIPGVDVELGKNPGGIVVSAPTNKDGTYEFIGLAPGKYDLLIAGKRVQTLTVGANRSVRGSLTRNDDGTASITFNGQAGVVPILPSAPVNTSRSDKKAGIAKGEKSPLPTPGGITTDPRNGVGGTGGGRLAFAGADDANSALAGVPTNRGTAPGRDGKLALPGVAGYTNHPSYLPAPPFDAKILRVINNSETDTSADATSSGDGKTRTFEVTVQPANDPPSKVATGIPPPADPGGPPVKVQLRNVDTGALARTMPNSANGELAFTGVQPSGDYEISRARAGEPPSLAGGPPVTVQLRNVDTGALARTMPNSAKGELAFTGLPVGTYVVEIVDTAGKIVGTSPPQSVAAGGAFFTSTAGVPLRQNASADKPASSTVAANDAAASPVGGFGKGMPGSPGFGPDVGGMNGPGPGMMSSHGLGSGAPAMSGPMGGAGGRTGPMMGGGAAGRP